MANFAIIGAGGYIAPRHMQAIKDTGNQLVAAMDPNDSVGILDRYFPDARFFTEIERFDRHLEKLKRGGNEKIDYVSVCSPNYLHDSHSRLALRVDAHAICEKPLVVNPWNIDALAEIEQETGKKVYTVLQLRLLPVLADLKKKLETQPMKEKAEICLSYVTRRGPWYFQSWKGMEEKSGGVACNIGIHFFDFLLWLFGKPEKNELHMAQQDRMAGFLELEKARVRWFLSVDRKDLPEGYLEKGKSAYRSITMNGQELEFSDGFTDLHTQVYKDILNGGGFGLDQARPAVQAVYDMRKSAIVSPRDNGHPILKTQR